MIVVEQCKELSKLLGSEGALCSPFALVDSGYGVGGVVAVAFEDKVKLCMIFEVVKLFPDGSQQDLFFTDQALCAEGGEEVLDKAGEVVYRIVEEVTKRKLPKLQEELAKFFSNLKRS